MTLLYACIAPHGSETIPQLASKSALPKFQKTMEGLHRLADEVRRVRPDAIVIASPHNLRLWRNIAVVTSENSTGTLQASPRNKNSVTVKAKCDRKFAIELLGAAKRRKLPAIGANYGTSDGATSDMPMDWGTLVPLWFILPRCKPKPKIVIVAPSRTIPLKKNFQFGRLIGRLSERKRKRIVFIASADQGHGHRKTGPFGFNKASKKYDQFVIDAIQGGRIASIMKLNPKFVDAAKPDSLWQMTMLAGAIEGIRMKPRVISYDVPTYFGMICASFTRAG
jgi:aromatic ring-opening dioxygenase LigB subunit